MRKITKIPTGEVQIAALSQATPTPKYMHKTTKIPTGEVQIAALSQATPTPRAALLQKRNHTLMYKASIQNKPFRVYCVLHYVALKNPIEKVRTYERSLAQREFLVHTTPSLCGKER
jgi:hypothetical protein